jgi:predicted acyl esterase
MFLLDGRDGNSTMEWIAKQHWHEGGIVTNGMSALGIAQFVVAVLNSPHHAGMWIDWASPSGTSNNEREAASARPILSQASSHTNAAVFSQLSFPQGCFRQNDVTGWLNATARDSPEVMQV